MACIRMRFPGGKYKAFTMSYDDGSIHDVRLIAEMEKNGVKGTFNLNSARLLDTKDTKCLSASDAEVYKNQEVAVHGFKHLSLVGHDTGLIVNDVMTDRKELERIFGRVIKGMAYAYGTYDDTTIAALKACGIVYARTVGNVADFSLPKNWLTWAATCHHKNEKLNEYADKFLEAKDEGDAHMRFPMLFYVWGHSYEFDRANNWDLIENFLAKIGGRSDVWYATNGEIYAYVEAFKRLEFSAEGEYVYNPSAQDIYFLANGKLFVAKAGETTRIQIG